MRFLIILIATITFNQSLFSQSSSKADQLLTEMLENGHAGLAASYSVDGEILWENAVGYADINNKVPFTKSTTTRLASIAKPMTAFAVLQLVEKGLIDLDVPIQNYLPKFPTSNDQAITTRHLLSHTSGIDGYQKKEANNRTFYPSLEKAIEVFSDRALRFKPGSDFYYSSYGYVLLGAIIESVSGSSYEDYMRKNIWLPSNMKSTEVEYSNKKYENKSLLYHTNKKKTKEEKMTDLSNKIPGGGIHSNLKDVMNFGQAVLDNQFVDTLSFENMRKVSMQLDEGNPYGMGWFLYGPQGNEKQTIGHGGGQIGCNTFLFINLDTKVVVTILSNTSGTRNDIALLGVKLLQIANAIATNQEP